MYTCRLANPLKKMMDPEFFEFLSRYKFVFAIENAICDDYMTEKLWRPLHIGSVPIVLGSSRVQVSGLQLERKLLNNPYL